MHLSVEHLLAVASRDDLVFTLEEFRHLKSCSLCFRLWAEFVHRFILQQSTFTDEI
jgi:hypothetical protein